MSRKFLDVYLAYKIDVAEFEYFRLIGFGCDEQESKIFGGEFFEFVFSFRKNFKDFAIFLEVAQDQKIAHGLHRCAAFNRNVYAEGFFACFSGFGDDGVFIFVKP